MMNLQFKVRRKEILANLLLKYFFPEYGSIGSVDVHPTDPNIIAVTAHNKVQLFNVATFEIFKSLSKFQDTAFSGKFRHDGGLLCAGTGEGSVKVFDVNTKALLRVMAGKKMVLQ